MYFKNITMQLPSHAQIQVVPAENILVHPTIAFKISAFSQTSHCHKGLLLQLPRYFDKIDDVFKLGCEIQSQRY